MNRVFISQELQNYQILQQHMGICKIELSGEYESDFSDSEIELFLRVVDEKSRDDVVPPIYFQPREGHWMGEITIPAGGPYSLVSAIQCNKREVFYGDVISHICAGDLYLIAGQSNAVGYGKDPIWDPPSENVHVLKLDGTWDIASHPIHNTTGSHYARLTEQGRHSPWLQCAKIIASKIGYPIGLIPSAQAGLPLSCWDRREDGSMLDLMIERVKEAGGEIAGVLWYQGCSDTDIETKRNTYFERFSYMCRDFRDTLDRNVPFLTVQINKQMYLTGDAQVHAKNWSVVREAQRKAAKKLPNVYIVPSMDLTVGDTIHNTSHSNIVIGKRAADVLLQHVYGFRLCSDAPDLKSAEKIGADCIALYFENSSMLATDAYDVSGLVFEIYDVEGTNTITAYECPGDDSIRLKLTRPLMGEAYISCSKHSESGFMPYDLITRLPALAFDHIRIES